MKILVVGNCQVRHYSALLGWDPNQQVTSVDLSLVKDMDTSAAREQFASQAASHDLVIHQQHRSLHALIDDLKVAVNLIAMWRSFLIAN